MLLKNLKNIIKNKLGRKEESNMIGDKKKYICPICGYDKLTGIPYYNGVPQYDICFCCGFEFGYTDDDQGETFDSWREKWLLVKKGAWAHEKEKPADWNTELLLKQLKNIQYAQYFKLSVDGGIGKINHHFTIDDYINEISDIWENEYENKNDNK